MRMHTLLAVVAGGCVYGCLLVCHLFKASKADQNDQPCSTKFVGGVVDVGEMAEKTHFCEEKATTRSQGHNCFQEALRGIAFSIRKSLI